MKLQKIKTLRQITGKQSNHEQRFLGSEFATFVANHLVMLKALVLQKLFYQKKKGGENKGRIREPVLEPGT